jgi:hypothetical protein
MKGSWQKTAISTNVDGPVTLVKRVWPNVYANFIAAVTLVFRVASFCTWNWKVFTSLGAGTLGTGWVRVGYT